MGDQDSPESIEDTLLDCVPTNLLPLQPSGPPEPLLTATASPNGAAPQIFHRFSNLPPELRIAIWEFSLPHRVYPFPCPSIKFDFFNNWWVKQDYGAKAEQPPAIAHVCSEARALAMASGSLKNMLLVCDTNTHYKWSRVWVDSKRDTAVIDMLQPVLTNFNDHFYDLLSNRNMHVALCVSWTMSWAHEQHARHARHARIVYSELVHGHKECDFVILDLQLDMTEEEAASTGLFSNSGAIDSVLFPIEDTRQMSRLFDAQAKCDTQDYFDTWKNFTQFRGRTSLVEFIQRWKKLAAREMRKVQRTLDFLTGVEVGRQGKDVGELREQAARAAKVRAEHPKLRPVIMVSRGVGRGQ